MRKNAASPNAIQPMRVTVTRTVRDRMRTCGSEYHIESRSTSVAFALIVEVFAVHGLRRIDAAVADRRDQPLIGRRRFGERRVRLLALHGAGAGVHERHVAASGVL